MYLLIGIGRMSLVVIWSIQGNLRALCHPQFSWASFFIRAYFSDQFGDISLSSFSSFLRKNDITDTEENNSGFLRRLFLEEKEDVKEIFDAKSERFYAPFGGYICYFSLSRNIMATSLFQKMTAYNNISL